MSKIRVLMTPVLLLVAALVAVPASASADDGDRTLDRLQAAGLASTIALNNCSGSLVRFDSSTASDRALLLTNGHCLESGGLLGGVLDSGFLEPGEVVVNRSSSRSGTLLDANGDSLGTVRADRVLYATMTGTDVALYRLTQTYAQIESSTGASPLTVSDTRPADGSAITIPSSYWKRTYSCAVDGFVPTLRESDWTWQDSIRYAYPNPSCETIGGTSGSPIVDDASLEVVGVNNTTNEDGASCTLNNPCEVSGDGSTTQEQGQNYGQQTYWFTTCLGGGNTIDLNRQGCLLAKP